MTGKIKYGIKAFSLAAAMALTISLAGCKEESLPEEPEKTEVLLWYYWDIGRTQTELANLIEEFNNSQDRILVHAQYIPDESFKKRMALGAADDAMPDLALVDSCDFQYMHEMRPFVELTEEIGELEEYLPGALKPCTIDDRIYGLPFGVNCLAMFCNSQMLAAAGCAPPENWEDFFDAAVKTSVGDTDGFALSALQSEEAMYSFLPILWSMGGTVDTIDSPESGQAFRLVERLRHQDVLNKQCISLTLTDLVEQFVEGNIAMMFNTPMVIQTIREENPDLDFEVLPLPTGGEPLTVAGGEIFGVTSGAHQKEAVEFLKFIADKVRMAGYMDDFGFLAPREDLMRDQYPTDRVRRMFVDYYQYARLRECTVSWPRLSLVITDALSQVIIGERPTEEILEEASEEIREIRKGTS